LKALGRLTTGDQGSSKACGLAAGVTSYPDMRTLLAIVPLLVGCRIGVPSTPAEQLKEILGKNDYGGKLGHLDSNLLGVTDQDVARSPRITAGQFTMLGIISGELCFSYEAESVILSKRERAGVTEGRMGFMKNSTWIFEAHDSEATIRDAWPPQTTTHVTKTELQSDRIRTKTSRPDGATETHSDQITRIENCGPAPEIKPTTKYVTITNFRQNETPLVLVWKLDAPPSEDFLASQARIAADPTMRPDAATEAPATEPPASELPASNDSVMKVLASAGDLTMFSTMLAETGIDRELATGGPYMVIALSDRALSRADPAKLKDKALVKRAIRTQIVIGVFSSGKHTVKTLDGVTFDIELVPNGTIHRTKPTTSNVKLVGHAKNAVVYRED
jgi:hypothetical protein